jgi:non-heme chloroperoxidase
MRALVQAFPAKPLPPEEVESLLGSSMTVPAPIRASLQAREINGDDVLRTLRMAVLVSHGRADTVILPAMAEHILATCPVADPPGTTESATPPSWKTPTASTTSWPR